MQRGETAQAVAIDASGDVVLAGSGASPDFPVVAPFQPNGGPGFVAKVSLNSSAPTLSVSRSYPWVHVRNVGTAPVAISSISVSPAATFALSGTCGTTITLAAATECIAIISQTAGPPFATADLTIASNVAGSPQSFVIQPSQNFPPEPWLYSPAGLLFAPQFLGTTSISQRVTLTNLASQAITVDSLQSSSTDFSVLDGCTGVIAPLSSCTFDVAFSPTSNKTLGQIRLNFSAPFITGTGNPPEVQDLFGVYGTPTVNSLSVSVQGLTFGGQYPGVPGMPRIVTLFQGLKTQFRNCGQKLRIVAAIAALWLQRRPL